MKKPQVDGKRGKQYSTVNMTVNKHTTHTGTHEPPPFSMPEPGPVQDASTPLHAPLSADVLPLAAAPPAAHVESASARESVSHHQLPRALHLALHMALHKEGPWDEETCGHK